MKIQAFTALIWLSLITIQASAQQKIDCEQIHPPKQNVVCIKKDYELALKMNPESKKMSAELIKEGDLAFKKKQLLKAYKAYDLAKLNLANAYSFIRLGDTVLTALATGNDFRDKNGKQTGACLVPSEFIWTVDGVLNDDYETGIELAKILSAGPPVSQVMLAETEKKSICIKALAAQYRNMKTGCVDQKKISECIGLPITKK